MQNPCLSPLLSIVLPVYNGENFIQDCLHSIQEAVNFLPKQEQNKIEIIVCDNHSTDGTLAIAIAENFNCNYRILQPPEHYQNRTMNWHYALNQAQGIWMMMIHADDQIATQGLGRLLSICQHRQDSSIVMIAGQIRAFTDDTLPSRLRPYWPFPALIQGQALRKKVLPLICPFVPFTVMRRSAYLKIQGLNPQYELVQDWELWIRLLALGDFYYYPQEFGWWRTHEFSEKYANIFALEHSYLAYHILELIPDLSSKEFYNCLKTQLAKAKNWVPHLSEIAVSKTRSNLDDIKFELLPSIKQAQQQLKWANWYVVIQLQWLRFWGGLKLLKLSNFS